MLSTSDVVALVGRAIARKEPFSLIRVGDGEGFLLAYDGNVVSEELELQLRMYFGDNVPDGEGIWRIRAMLIEAIAGASVLGLHFGGRPGSKWQRSKQAVEALGVRETQEFVCSASIHQDLHEANALEGVCRDRSSIGIITPRMVADDIRTRWQVKHVHHVMIPEEVHYAKEPSLVERHYPDRFDELLKSGAIDAGLADLWLVGAGVLGKIYAESIRAAGGVALDIGSIFDAWAGHTRRRNVRGLRPGL